MDWQTMIGGALIIGAALLWLGPSIKLPRWFSAVTPAPPPAADSCRAYLLHAYRIAVENSDYKTAEAVNRILCGSSTDSPKA